MLFYIARIISLKRDDGLTVNLFIPQVLTGVKMKILKIILLSVFVIFTVQGCSGNDNKKDDISSETAAKLEETEFVTETESSDDLSDDNDSQTVDETSNSIEETSVTKEDTTDPDDILTKEETTQDLSDETNKGDEMQSELLYQGHASVRIVTKEGKVIYIDPFRGEGYDLPADLILMTHEHYDHTQDNLITSRNPDCSTIKWTEALQGGEHQSFDLGYVKVEAVEAGYNKNHDASNCVGFILTFSDGITVYFSGDTSTTPTMTDLADRKLDYAFICCDGVYNMDVTEASECAKVINAKHTIPYHMEPSSNEEGFDITAAESFDGPGKIILRPGEKLELE